MSKHFNLELPAEALSKFDPSDTDDGRLYGTCTSLGATFSLEAVPVHTVDGLQVGTSAVAESRLTGLAAEFDAGAFQTIRRHGRDFVLFITPHSA